MGSATMGRTLVTAKIENLKDIYLAKEQKRRKGKVRSIEVSEALVRRGEVFLFLPTRFLNQLGLERVGSRRIRTLNGIRAVSVYEPVRLTIQGRACTAEVLEIPHGRTIQIGQLLLEALDFVIDPKRQRLIGNPEHGGKWVVDMFQPNHGLCAADRGGTQGGRKMEIMALAACVRYSEQGFLPIS